MSKRVRFDEEAITAKVGRYTPKDQPSSSKEYEKTGPGSRFKEDHSLDSDEEDENGDEKKEQFEKLTEEDVEGAEDEENDDPYENEDGPRITPFNLKEEMEEGDFDKTGHYHFNKDKEIHDNWLDNIDWVKIKKVKKSEDVEMSSGDEGPDDFDEVKILGEIVQLLQKGETVSGGLRRLGGKEKTKKKGAQRSWKKEKVYDLEAGDEDTEKPMDEDTKLNDEKEKKERFLQLTELADQMAGAGHYDIYSDTFEKIQYKLNSLKVSKLASIPEGANADDALDIFADDIDASELNKPTKVSATPTEQDDKANGNDDASVKWEYKWKADADETFGPFTSQQMAEWKEEGFFNKEVKVRKVAEGDVPFYDAKRIDFDLYE
uniref:CD2 antigen cytoplasmic tail-binding protein 2 n=1 Tax=Phallusia mammillata TaxID=59560 RepID=A0A6F9D819_9ASCI|nr:CD2 antigen cytoplasmic tail-binding protein 2 [Phallusia mammillata]